MQVRVVKAVLFSTLALLVAQPASAQKKYGPGVTDTEVKIGQSEPFSGPASGYGTVAKIEAIYYDMINASGGVNGRKINLISLDDAFSPPKAIEQTRKLVESDNVLAIVGSFGTAVNIAISKYLNTNNVPQLLAASSSDKLNDPANFPWTTTFFLPQQMEARIYANWILKNQPDAKIGVLFQNDDYGKGFVDGLKAGLGDKASSMIVKEASYDLSSPTVDSQVLALRAAGANVFFHASLPKFSAQALAKSKELGWTPLHIVTAATSSTIVAMEGVGGENAAGIVTSLYLKDPSDPKWDNDPGMQNYRAFMKKWAPTWAANESSPVMGYSVAEMFVTILKKCGDDLSRENLLKQATNISDVQLSMFIPGVTVNVTPQDRGAYRNLQLARYDGKHWIPMGGVIGAAR